MVLVTLGILTGLAAAMTTGKINRYFEGLTADSLPGLEGLPKVQNAIDEQALLAQESWSARAVDRASIETRMNANETTTRAQLKAYASEVSDEERPLYQALSESLDRFFRLAEKTEAGAGWATATKAAQRLNESRELLTQTTKALQAELLYNQATGDAYIASGYAAIRTANRLIWSLVALTLVLGIFLTWRVVRGTNYVLGRSVNELRATAGGVTDCSAEIASASQELAEGSSSQAASLEETSAASQQISALTRKTADNSRRSALLMGEVDQRVVAAGSKMDVLAASMAEIMISSQRIAKIIQLIDGIAFQTNILALNAAVEAARAGDLGLGFAVVADEVRSLAQRSAQAAKDTASLIDESVKSVGTGSARLSEVVAMFGEVATSAKSVKGLVEEVSLGSGEQAQGIDQIAKALLQMEQLTQKTAASAEQSAAAAHQLKAQAEAMQVTVVALEELTAGRVKAAINSGGRMSMLQPA